MAREKRVFTEEETEYILSHWEKESIHSMKKKFHCTWSAIAKVGENAGLALPESNNWTEEEIEALITMSDKFHYKKIAKILGKTENAVYLKARKLNIVLIQDARKWTYEEECKLKELWGTKRIEIIAKELKRTVFSLKVRAVRMNLGPMLQNNYEVITVSDISDILGVSRDRIVLTWPKLGLNLQKIKLTKDASYYVVVWEDLMDFLEKNQNEWDSRNVEPYMLATEPDWLVEKRRRDSIEDPIWYRCWTKEELDKAEHYFLKGMSYEEIGEKLHRKKGAVYDMLYNLGYRSKFKWEEEEISYLNEHYLEENEEVVSEYLGRSKGAVKLKAKQLGLKKE